jgi:hypothetical protein
LDSCAGCVFRKRTPDESEELLAKIGRNHDDWTIPEPTPTPILKKRGLIYYIIKVQDKRRCRLNMAN